MRASHPVEFNRGIDVERRNRRWTYEELVVLAAMEREVRARGYQGNINKELASLVPTRTPDSIKGARSKLLYRGILDNEIMEEPGGDEDRGDGMAYDVGGRLGAAIRMLVEEINSPTLAPVLRRLVTLSREALAGVPVGDRLGELVTDWLAERVPMGAGLLRDNGRPGGGGVGFVIVPVIGGWTLPSRKSCGKRTRGRSHRGFWAQGGDRPSTLRSGCVSTGRRLWRNPHAHGVVVRWVDRGLMV